MTPLCVFCNILAGRAKASFVYRDASVAAFMSLEQPNAYKVLVVPTAHVETLYDLTDAQTAELFQVVVKVARAIRLVSGCDGLKVQSNGAAGQQDVPHLHVICCRAGRVTVWCSRGRTSKNHGRRSSVSLRS